MKYYAYVSIAGEKKISIFTMDPETGKLQLQEDVTFNAGPGPLATDPERKFLYVGIRPSPELSTFRIDHSTGGLSHIGTVSLDADPCYLSTDRNGNFLLSAYYGAGKAAVHAITSDGTVADSPVESRDTAKKAHCILTDPSNKFAFLPHVGESNAIFQFQFDENSGTLTPNAVPQVAPEPGVGPRHFVFHPHKDMIYVSNEQGSSVTTYNFDPSSGTLTALQTLSTLPEGYDGDNTCAQIHITPSGKYLYVSNRGHDSIACYATDNATGQLTALGQQPTEPIPRPFGIDPTGNFLYAGGQPSGKLAAYRIDAETGRLSPLETYTVGKQSMWVLILELPD